MNNKIARTIGYFYFEKENQNEDAATSAIDVLRISNIEYQDDGIVCITLSRPGFLIGKKGENIKQLLEYLKKEIKEVKEIKIKENNTLDHLYDFDIRGMDDGY